MKVKISSDSACDLPEEMLEAYDIAIAPMTVTLGERSGHDGIDIVPDDIYDYVKSSGSLPKTSAVSVGEYTEFFRKARASGNELVHISIGSHFSASWQNACLAAEEVGGVWVVDSENLSSGQGLMVLRAAELSQEGKSAAEIAEECQKMSNLIETSFVLDTIDYLYKGGRCSAVSALSASLLHIKPCIEVHDGTMAPGEKYHGNFHHAVMEYLENHLKDRQDIDLKRIVVCRTNVDDATFREACEMVKRLCPNVGEIIEARAGATITTHCGPNCLGVLFVRNK